MTAEGEPFLAELEDLTERTTRFITRTAERRAFRKAQGRDLGAPTVEQLAQLRDAIAAAATELSTLLAETAPPNDPAELRRIHQALLEQLGRGGGH